MSAQHGTLLSHRRSFCIYYSLLYCVASLSQKVFYLNCLHVGGNRDGRPKKIKKSSSVNVENVVPPVCGTENKVGSTTREISSWVTSPLQARRVYRAPQEEADLRLHLHLVRPFLWKASYWQRWRPDQGNLQGPFGLRVCISFLWVQIIMWDWWSLKFPMAWIWDIAKIGAWTSLLKLLLHISGQMPLMFHHFIVHLWFSVQCSEHLTFLSHTAPFYFLLALY